MFYYYCVSGPGVPFLLCIYRAFYIYIYTQFTPVGWVCVCVCVGSEAIHCRAASIHTAAYSESFFMFIDFNFFIWMSATKASLSTSHYIHINTIHTCCSIYIGRYTHILLFIYWCALSSNFPCFCPQYKYICRWEKIQIVIWVKIEIKTVYHCRIKICFRSVASVFFLRYHSGHFICKRICVVRNFSTNARFIVAID